MKKSKTMKLREKSSIAPAAAVCHEERSGKNKRHFRDDINSEKVGSARMQKDSRKEEQQSPLWHSHGVFMDFIYSHIFTEAVFFSFSCTCARKRVLYILLREKVSSRNTGNRIDDCASFCGKHINCNIGTFKQ